MEKFTVGCRNLEIIKQAVLICQCVTQQLQPAMGLLALRQVLALQQQELVGHTFESKRILLSVSFQSSGQPP